MKTEYTITPKAESESIANTAIFNMAISHNAGTHLHDLSEIKKMGFMFDYEAKYKDEGLPHENRAELHIYEGETLIMVMQEKELYELSEYMADIINQNNLS